MSSASAFAFGPFHLDPRGKRLLRNGTVVPLPSRQFHLLHALVSRPNEVLTKEQLINAAWPDAAVTDNSLAQAMLKVRTIVNGGDSGCSIDTARGFGYRFVGVVETIDVRLTHSDLDALLAPHRGFTEGRAALETLSRDRIAEARRIFEHLLTRHSDDPTVHVGLANACVLAFESTRAEAAPDVDALRSACVHAREACRLNPESGEAFATLGFVLERTGDRHDAVAALRRAVTLEPDNWRHHLRRSYGTWGEERRRAAHHVLTLLPGCPMAHLLAATVFVARNALTQAERELDAGLASMADESTVGERFTPVALHWLKGLLCLARNEENEALAAFDRELALEPRGHLYARECSANAWYAIGACHVRRGDRPAARAAFGQAIARIPRHPMAHAGLALASGSSHVVPNAGDGSVDAALARAVALAATGAVADAVPRIARALSSAPPGNAGWLLPVEPLLRVAANRAAWAPVLGMLRTRAS